MILSPRKLLFLCAVLLFVLGDHGDAKAFDPTSYSKSSATCKAINRDNNVIKSIEISMSVGSSSFGNVLILQNRLRRDQFTGSKDRSYGTRLAGALVKLGAPDP